MFFSFSKWFFSILSILALATIGGCTHPTDTGVKPDSGIGGRVYLVDTVGNVLLPAGITVTLDNPQESTVTDDSGNWQFRNLGFGSWTVTFTKPGFGTAWVMPAKNVGDVLPKPPAEPDPNWFLRIPNVVLGEVPKMNVVIDSIGHGIASSYPYDPDSTRMIWTHFDSPSRFVREDILMYFSDDPTFLQSANHLLTLTMSSNGNEVLASQLKAANFTAGTKAYVSVAAMASSTTQDPIHDQIPSVSWDTAHKQDVYTACGPRSNILSFIVPY